MSCTTHGDYVYCTSNCKELPDDPFERPRWIELVRLINVYGQSCVNGYNSTVAANYIEIKRELKRIDLKNPCSCKMFEKPAPEPELPLYTWEDLM